VILAVWHCHVPWYSACNDGTVLDINLQHRFLKSFILIYYLVSFHNLLQLEKNKVKVLFCTLLQEHWFIWGFPCL
jgi:hypothetical protein